MLNRLLVLLLSIVVLFTTVSKAEAFDQCTQGECRVAGSSAQLTASSVLIEKTSSYNDRRVGVLRDYLSQFGSPLSQYADIFIRESDKYKLDWRLVPAISGAESTFGNRVAFDSRNPFGYAGGYFSFESWEKAIEVETEMLAEKYRDKWGLVTPEEIMPIYAPPSLTWAKNVRFFMNEISSFENKANRLALNL